MIGTSQKRSEFEAVVLPHLDAAYNLARWLVRDPHDADDVVQEACVRAFRFFGGFRGGDSRGWLLAIVRNTSYSWLQKRRPEERAAPLDEEHEDADDGAPSAESEALRHAAGRSIAQALEALPLALREAIVLREIQGLSYAEIATVSDVPVGTVMSRLSRARRRLQTLLGEASDKEASS